MIDLLQFVPKKTASGYNILIEHINKNNEEYLRLSYKHPRARPIEIRRFVDPSVLGSLLGQYQAEGTKYNNLPNKSAIEFSNKLVSEHKNFIEDLENIGIGKNTITSRLLDSEKRTDREKRELIESYEKQTGIKVKYYYYFSKHGSYGYKTIIRNTILTKVILNAMNYFRVEIAKGNHTNIRNTFFAKLLTGDGTFGIDNRRPVPRMQISIKDCNMEYLKDYEEIMRKLDFHYVRKYDRYMKVEAKCTFKDLIYLYKIRAFENTNNWNKILVAIGICLNGVNYKTKLRFFDLENKIFTSKNITQRYNLHPATRKWLLNMEKNGFVECVERKSPFKYKLTENANDFMNIINSWKRELDNLIKATGISDLNELIDNLKIKRYLKSSK